MIFNTNRTASLGEQSIDVNENYFGARAYDFAQEAAQDELSIFEMAIKCDIDETIIGESVSEIEALHEGFVQSAVDKIKKLMEKFKQWIIGVIRTVYAKLTQFLTVDNAKFVKKARTQINKMGGMKDFKAKDVKVFKISSGALFASVTSEGKSMDIGRLASLAKLDAPTAKDVEEGQDILDGISRLSVSKTIELNTEKRDIKIEDVNKALSSLEEHSKKNLKEIKAALDKDIKEANDIIKAAKSLEKKADEKNTETAHNKVRLAGMYKQAAQKLAKFYIGYLSKAAKINRGIVARAMTGKIDEGFEYESEELMEANLEAFEYELESSLEETKCCEDDEKFTNDIEADDEDEDDED